MQGGARATDVPRLGFVYAPTSAAHKAHKACSAPHLYPRREVTSCIYCTYHREASPNPPAQTVDGPSIETLRRETSVSNINICS